MRKIENSSSNTQCCVPQCKSRSTNEISLIRFPKDESQKKKWTDAIKIEKGMTQNMQICSRHFVKNDYIISDVGGTKVKRLKKSAVPSQNLPWQFPNKRVSPTLAKARMERLKNRSQLKTSDSPVKESPGKKSIDVKKSVTTKKAEGGKKSEGTKKSDDLKREIKESDSSSEKYEDSELKHEELHLKMSDDEEDYKEIENSSLTVKDENEDRNGENTEEAVDKDDDETTEAKKGENNMTRAPTRLRQKKGVIKCEYCGRKCLTPQALQTHQQIAHKNARNNIINPKKEPNTNHKAKSSPKPSQVGFISVKSPESLQQPKKPLEKSLNSSEVEKVLLDDSDFMDTASDSDASGEETVKKHVQRKIEFECPICKKRFSVFFQANKHIQKYHGAWGAQLGREPPLLPKPTRIELCTICNMSVDGNIHSCSGPLKMSMGLICTGCEQEYKTLTLFDMHKSSRHNDGVESMFFPALDEFNAWKRKMQNQTRTKYTMMDQNDTKKMHRCTHRTPLGAGSNSKQRMCPSSIVVQEFAKGFQVHYYPNHYGHTHEKYSLGKAFKKYSISSLMNRTANQLPDSDEEDHTETDLYLQFKKLTNVLVDEAARINVNGLKKLMRKALDMIAIVNSYVEDADDDMITSSVIKLDTDKDDLQDQVKKALSSLKRPSEMMEVTPAKRSKSVFQSTENLKNKDVKTTPNIKEEVIPKKEPSKFNQSPSFIDTFQDFVGKAIVKPVEKKKRQSDGKKNAKVKTKMGQFKPKSPAKTPLSPKSPKTESPKQSVKEIEYEVKEQENDCNILILKI